MKNNFVSIFAVFCLFSNLASGCARSSEIKKDNLTNLPNVLLDSVTDFLAKQTSDYPILDFETLERITALNQQIVSTENLKEACEILNNLLNLKNSSQQLNKHCKKLLSKLLQANIINFSDIGGNTVLHFACQKGYAHVVQFLIDNGANINVYANEEIQFGTTTIIRGRQFDKEFSEYFSVVKKNQKCPNDQSILIERNIEIKEWHPIFDAYINKHDNCVKLLLNHNPQELNKSSMIGSFGCHNCIFVFSTQLFFSGTVGGSIAVMDLLYDVNFRESLNNNNLDHTRERLFDLIREYAIDFDLSPDLFT